MWKKAMPLLVILSVALNLAFAAVWIAHALSERLAGREQRARETAASPIWHPLHQQLELGEQQWREIEPRLKQLQETSQGLCQHIRRLRGEILDIIREPEPDRNAIRARQQEILEGQRKMQSLVIEHLLAEKQLLTPEQQSRLLHLIRQCTACRGRGPLMGLGRCDGRCRSGERDNSPRD